MNAVELSQLLGEIQVVDNRRVDKATLLAWMPLLEDVDYYVAVEAVRLHRRESNEWLTPALIRVNVERIRLAGLGAREDELGNLLEPDAAALAAHQRLSTMKAVTS